MAGRIDETVFWSGINPNIIKTRDGCMTCVRRAPTQPAGFPVSLPSPYYPFQMIVADYFSLHGHNFLVIADRFTGWNVIVSTPQGKLNVQHLVTIMNDFCATLNIPEHITRDGGPQMMSGVFQKWMKDWDITHRLSRATTEPRQQSSLPRGFFKIVC